jgi:5'(3')-deoxyribonucleotidase
MPDGQQILADVETIAGAENVCLLSAPSEHPGSATGKIKWIQKHLPGYRKRYLLGPSKGFVAAPGKILVDDGDHNIADWNKKGGYAVLVPRPWNSLHHLTTTPDYFIDSIYVVRKMARIDTKRF